MRQGGLLPTPPDERDYQLGSIKKLPELKELPFEFLVPVRVKDQRDSDFCSAFMSCAMSEPQENIELEPSYSFALSKQISGNVDAWGQDIRTALQAHVKYGALPKQLSMYSLKNKDDKFLRNIKNWKFISDRQNIVRSHKKKSFFKVTGQYDHFDNARASLYEFRSPIGMGVIFGWPMSQHILKTIPKHGFGHAMTVIGFVDEYLIILNSYGYKVGDNGVHYMTRDVYNHFVEEYGHYMFVDIDKERAQWLLENGVTLDDNWLAQLWKSLKKSLLC